MSADVLKLLFLLVLRNIIAGCFIKRNSEDYREGYMGIRCIFMRRDASSWFFVYVMRVHVYNEGELGSRACITWNNKWRIPKGICLTRRKVPHGHPRSAIHKS